MTAQIKRVMIGCAATLLFAGAGMAQSESLESGIAGLIEPFRSVNLASSENGVLREIPVVEGQRVRAGDLIAVLDDELQATQLKIAYQRMTSEGELNVAKAELDLRRMRLEKLRKLLDEGHARSEEVRRAETDLNMAQARLTSQLEEQAVRELEHLRAQQTLERRKIRSPIDGVVSKLDREEGEFLSPVRPEVGQIIQTNPVMGVFAVPLSEVRNLKPGYRVSVTANRGDPQLGLIESVGVTIHSASETVKVRVRLRNDDAQLLVGQACILRGPATPPSQSGELGSGQPTPATP